MSIRSHRSHEGYLLHDNRVAGGVMLEAPTYTCSHCQTVVVLNPLRNRERAWCSSCVHKICDTCGAARGSNGGRCTTFKEIIDQVQNTADRGLPVDYRALLASALLTSA